MHSCNSKLELYSNDSFLKVPTFICPNCKSYVSYNDTLEKKIAWLYKNQYWNDREAEKAISSNYTDVNSQGKRRNFVSQFEYVKPYLGKKILEIGVGAGQTLYWLDKIGYDVMGIEPDPRNVYMINKKIGKTKVIQSFIEDIDLEQTYDFIWVSHVLEHLARPDVFLKKISNNIKKDGVIFIEVPNCENPETLRASITENPHVHHFSKKGLEILCKEYDILSLDCFRPATKKEAVINRIKKIPNYPRIKDDKGRDMRILIRRKN